MVESGCRWVEFGLADYAFSMLRFSKYAASKRGAIKLDCIIREP